MSLTSKYVKLPSLQGVSNIADGQLLDFDIPNDGIYNLANSYVSITCNATSTETDNAVVGIHNITAITPSERTFRNNVFVGDYEFRCDNLGTIESVQDSNIISANFDTWARDFEQVEAENYKSFGQYSNEYWDQLWLQSNMRRLNKDTVSEEIPFEIKIPLSSFSSFCNTQVYSATKYGKSRLHMQFKSNKFNARENMPNSDQADPNVVYGCIDKGSVANTPQNVITTVYGARMTL